MLLWTLMAALWLALRLHRLSPLSSEAPLAPGQRIVEGTLSVEAWAPAGILRLHRGDHALRLVLDGAHVVRASQLRPRSEPGGDVVDMALGASVVASGRLEPGALLRGE